MSEAKPRTDEHNSPAQDALERMKRAFNRGTGCSLTAEMIHGLGLTFLAETWNEPDPRTRARMEDV